MWNRIVLYDEELVNDEPKQAGERSVHRLLTQTLREEAAPDAANCLDAETVAAWMDGVLPADVLAAAEGHAAGCARCQAVLSAMARTAPPVARGSWWPASPTFRFLVPATAAATAVALWIAVAPGMKQPEPPASSSEFDRVASVPAPSMAPLPPSAERPAPPPPPAHLSKKVEENKESVRTRQVARETSAANAPEQFEYRRNRAEGAKLKDESLAATPKSADATIPPAAAKSLPAAPVASPAPPPSAASLPLGNAAAAPRADATSPISQSAGFRAARTLLTEIASPHPESRWRAGAGGVVHRSTDGGLTWTRQQTGTTANFTAGSSPARDVCWLVGRAGTVLLSVDGTTWQARSFPETADLVAVQAADARTATVTTSDGRRFSTTDGGATWSRPSPQEFPLTPFNQ
jgi:hypothetical protein